MSAATHDEIVSVIGEVDELIIERIAATGASLDHILEAWGDLQQEWRATGDLRSTSRHVTVVRAILEEVVARDDEDERAWSSR